MRSSMGDGPAEELPIEAYRLHRYGQAVVLARKSQASAPREQRRADRPLTIAGNQSVDPSA
jgi:hypothetical protein